MNIEIIEKNTKMLVDFHQYSLPSGPPPVEFMHEHNYPEIHLVLNGNLTVATKNSQYFVERESAVIMPAGFYHSVSTNNPDAKWFAFSINTPCVKISQKSFPDNFLTSFFTMLDSNTNGENSHSIINYLMFISNELTDAKMYSHIPNRDYMEEIHNFLSTNYAKKLHISDVAAALHISETHAQRIIKKCTGKYFGGLVRSHRMLVADMLAKKSKMTMQDIATTVGYSSYSGFWKAYLKYEKEKNQ